MYRYWDEGLSEYYAFARSSEAAPGGCTLYLSNTSAVTGIQETKGTALSESRRNNLISVAEGFSETGGRVITAFSCDVSDGKLRVAEQ